jgi:hypothetical protein
MWPARRSTTVAAAVAEGPEAHIQYPEAESPVGGQADNYPYPNSNAFFEKRRETLRFSFSIGKLRTIMRLSTHSETWPSLGLYSVLWSSRTLTRSTLTNPISPIMKQEEYNCEP